FQFRDAVCHGAAGFVRAGFGGLGLAELDRDVTEGGDLVVDRAGHVRVRVRCLQVHVLGIELDSFVVVLLVIGGVSRGVSGGVTLFDHGCGALAGGGGVLVAEGVGGDRIDVGTGVRDPVPELAERFTGDGING